MSRPNFEDIARAWLVRAQGHSRPEYEKSLGKELERVWDLGITSAIEAVGDDSDHEDRRSPLREAAERIRAKR